MILICAWCARDGLPSVLGEKRPFRDLHISHGICPRHEVELLAREREIQRASGRIRHHTPSFIHAPEGSAICLACDKTITTEDFLNESCPGKTPAPLSTPASA